MRKRNVSRSLRRTARLSGRVAKLNGTGLFTSGEILGQGIYSLRDLNAAPQLTIYSRHQILIKATNLGLKESSGRAPKRRRENESDTNTQSPSVPPSTSAPSSSVSAVQNSSAPASAPPHTASPSQSQPTSTPAASPALQHQQRPASSKGLSSSSATQSSQTTTPTSSLPWPMPTVAVNTPSPVIGSATVNQDHRASYYRPRPVDNAQKSTPMVHHQPHPYMYQPQPNGGTRNVRENGK